MMKQLIAFGLTFGLVLSLAACGRGTVENSSAPEKSSAPASSQPLPQSSSEPEPSSAQEVSEQVSTAAVSREQFTYQSGGKDYSVFYPIFQG